MQVIVELLEPNKQLQMNLFPQKCYDVHVPNAMKKVRHISQKRREIVERFLASEAEERVFKLLANLQPKLETLKIEEINGASAIFNMPCFNFYQKFGRGNNDN